MSNKLTPAQTREKREKATRKLLNQLSVLSRTGTKEDKKLVKKMQPLAAKLSKA